MLTLHARVPLVPLFVLLALFSGLSSALFGDDSDEAGEDPVENATDDEIVIRAPGLEPREPGQPLRVSPVPAFEPGSPRSPRTLGDALNDLPQVMVQKTGPGQGSPFIRGFTGFRTLILVDGIRLNNSVFRDGPNQYVQLVDPLMLERADVLFGPTAIAHGTDAVGGTIDLRTRTPLLAREGVEYGGRFYQRFASAEDSDITRAEAEVRTQRFALSLGGSMKHYGDISAGRHQGELENTHYDEYSGDAKLLVRLGDTLDAVFAYQRHDQDEVPRTHSTILSQSYRGTTVGSDFRRDLDEMRELTYGRLIWFPDSETEAELTVYRYVLSEEEDRLRSNGRQRIQGFDDDTVGSTLRVTAETGIGRLTGGADYVYENVDSDYVEYNDDGTLREVRDRGPVADQSSYQQAGIFIEDTIQVGEQLEITIGGRYTFVHVDADQVDPDPGDADVIPSINDDFSAFVGGVRARYQATEPVQIFGSATQSYRAPNLADLTRFDAARSGEAEIPAPGLDPEQFLTLEAGTRITACCVDVTVSYYYTFIDDLIQRFPTGTTNADGDEEVLKDNVGDGFAHGVELSGTVDLPRDFSLFGGFAWMEGKVDNFVSPGVKDEEVLSRMQPAAALIGVRYEPEGKNVVLEADARIVDDQSRLSSRDQADTQRIPEGGTPGYTIFGVRGFWEPCEGVRLFAGIENLTDKDYRIHGSGSNEPGLSFVTGLDWRF